MLAPHDAPGRPLAVLHPLGAAERLLLHIQVRAVPRPVFVLRQEKRLLQHSSHRSRFGAGMAGERVFVMWTRVQTLRSRARAATPRVARNPGSTQCVALRL